MSNAAKCGRVRGWMADAASSSLSEARRREFERHVGNCAACRAEFVRMENLLGQIDQSLRTDFAVEPSPHLSLRVREGIVAETQSARLTNGWLGRNSWLSAAGVCVAMAALLIVVIAHRANRPGSNFVQHQQIVNSAPAHVPPAPSRSASAENAPPRAPAHVRVSKPHLAVARNESPRNPRRQNTKPEIIIQPGQMQAILQFVTETRNGKINGGEIEEGIKAAERPLEIKPLNIAPLDASAGGASETPGARSREPGSSDGRSE
jgi:hypothetical protein